MQEKEETVLSMINTQNKLILQFKLKSENKTYC